MREVFEGSSSSEDEGGGNSMEEDVCSRPRRRGRPSFKVSKKSSLLQHRTTKSLGGNICLADLDRDLSPVEQVREYFSDCGEEMVEDFVRIYQNMTDRMSSLGRSSRQIVHRTAAAAEKTAKSAAAAAEKTAKSAAEVPGKVLNKVREWKAESFDKLPAWMRDNEFLQFGHRPELNSYRECFKSVFRLHTETGNIWTHLVGFIVFITVTILFYVNPLCDYCNMDIDLSEKLIFLFFFIAAIFCLGCSSLFHTVCCHSEAVSNIFSRLDYAGIAVLTVGSFVPWIYYGFYCQFIPKVVYLSIISVLGTITVVVTMMDRFNAPQYRSVRAILFVCLGGFGFVPTIHLVIESGWNEALVKGGISCLLLMAFLYILGAVLYGLRIPERFLPGKFDLWFQSHQIFHVLVVFAAMVHYHGMTNMAVHRLTKAGECTPTEYAMVLQ